MEILLVEEKMLMLLSKIGLSVNLKLNLVSLLPQIKWPFKE
jgi:hypothetical protein